MNLYFVYYTLLLALVAVTATGASMVEKASKHTYNKHPSDYSGKSTIDF